MISAFPLLAPRVRLMLSSAVMDIIQVWNFSSYAASHLGGVCVHEASIHTQVVERVRRKAATYGQDITSSSSAPGLDNGDLADSARPAG